MCGKNLEFRKEIPQHDPYTVEPPTLVSSIFEIKALISSFTPLFLLYAPFARRLLSRHNYMYYIGFLSSM
jgi:hypothetical protein